MRMFTIFEPVVGTHGVHYDRVVDLMEELFKITLLLRGRTDYLSDRYSERNERAPKAIDRQLGQLRVASRGLS